MRARILAKFLAFVLIAMAVGGAAVQAQEMVLEVIPLRYRSADQVIPLIQPLVPREGSVSGLQNQLVVRTTPASLQEIRRVLASVDTMPRRLVITVRQDADVDTRQRGAEVSGSVGSDRGRITVPGNPERRGGAVVVQEGDSRVRAQAYDTRSLESDRNTQTVQVLEGNSALIRTGQSVPVPSRQVVRGVVGGRVIDQVVDTVEYRDVTTGFYVRPRISGDMVTVEISPQHDTLSRDIAGAVNVQRVATTVSGRLGEWIELGGVGQDQTHDRSVLLGSAQRTGRDTRRVLLKVEELR